MSEFSIICSDFNEGEEIPRDCGYKHGNKEPDIQFASIPSETKAVAFIMDDPDAMGAVGKVWVHHLWYAIHTDEEPGFLPDGEMIYGKADFGELGYGGPAPPDGRHTYVFKLYHLDSDLDLEKGFTKADLEDAMKGHILAEAKLTGTFAS